MAGPGHEQLKAKGVFNLVFNLIVVLASITAIVVSAVVYYSIPKPPPPLTLADASRRASDDLRQTVEKAYNRAAWQHYTLEPRREDIHRFCRKPDGFVTDQVIVTANLAVHDIDPARLDDYVLVLHASLPESGWDVRTDLYEPRDRFFVNATRDGYLLTIHTDENGLLLLSNSSPCAERS